MTETTSKTGSPSGSSGETHNKAPSSSDEGSLEENAGTSWMNPGTFDAKMGAGRKAPPPWPNTVPGGGTVATGKSQPTNVTLDDVSSVPPAFDVKNTNDVIDDDITREYSDTNDDVIKERSPAANEHPQSRRQAQADDMDVSMFSRNAKTSHEDEALFQHAMASHAASAKNAQDFIKDNSWSSRMGNRVGDFVARAGKAGADKADRLRYRSSPKITMTADQHHDRLKSTENLQKDLTIYPDPYFRSEMNVRLPGQGTDVKWHMEEKRTPPADASLLEAVAFIVQTVLTVRHVDTSLIDCAYLYGASVDLRWDTLWDYRTIQAQAAHGFLQDHYMSGKHLSVYTRYPLSVDATVHVLAAWIIAYAPLYLQKGLILAKGMVDQGATEPGTADDEASKEVIKWIKIATEAIILGLKRAKDGVVAFKIDHNWDQPDLGLAIPGRQYGRREPLQFPDRVPPRNKTHCHGRWVMRVGTRNMIWIEYPPCTIEESFTIPHNTPMTNSHWKYRTLMDGHEVKNVQEIVDKIQEVRTRQGLSYHEFDVTGPLLRHADGRVDQSRNVVIRKGKDILKNLREAVPGDADNRTPLRYTPVEAATQARYHGLDLEDMQKAQSGNDQGEAGNDATPPTVETVPDAEALQDEQGFHSPHTPPDIRRDGGVPQGQANELMDSLNGPHGDETPVTNNQSSDESPPEHLSAMDVSPSGFIAGPESMPSPVSHTSKNVRINTSAINVGDTSTSFGVQDDVPTGLTHDDYWSRKARPISTPVPSQQPIPASQTVAGNTGATSFFRNAKNAITNPRNMFANMTGWTPRGQPSTKVMHAAINNGMLGAQPSGHGGGQGSGHTGGQGNSGGNGSGGNGNGPPSGSMSGSAPSGPSGNPSGSGGSGGSGGNPPSAVPVPVAAYPPKTFRMKPDLSLFPKLTDEGKFPAFYRAFEAAAYGTDLGEVLDFRYVPQPDEVPSFRNKCRWVYNILYNNLQTTEGRNILYAHRRYKDGQGVLRDLIRHSSRSTGAVLRTGEIFGQLATTMLDSTWNRPFVDHISWFIRLCNTYNDMTPDPSDRLHDRMIRSML